MEGVNKEQMEKAVAALNKSIAEFGQRYKRLNDAMRQLNVVAPELSKAIMDLELEHSANPKEQKD